MKLSICKKSYLMSDAERLKIEMKLFSSAFEELSWDVRYVGYFIPINSMTKMNRWEVCFNEDKNPIDELHRLVGSDISYFFQS